MHRAIAAAARTLRRVAGTKLTYRRPGTNQSAELTATKGQAAFEIEDGSGLAIRVESWDWLLTTTDLVFADGNPFLPARGDQLDEVDAAGVTHTYALLELPGQPDWRYSDPYRVQVRIHTKHILPV